MKNHNQTEYKKVQAFSKAQTYKLNEWGLEMLEDQKKNLGVYISLLILRILVNCLFVVNSIYIYYLIDSQVDQQGGKLDCFSVTGIARPFMLKATYWPILANDVFIERVDDTYKFIDKLEILLKFGS